MCLFVVNGRLKTVARYMQVDVKEGQRSFGDGMRVLETRMEVGNIVNESLKVLTIAACGPYNVVNVPFMQLWNKTSIL